jgi:hypothetical protein
MARHSGGIFENFIENSPLLTESKNNIVPKPSEAKSIYVTMYIDLNQALVGLK